MKSSKTEKYLELALFGAIILMAAFPVMPNALKNVGFLVFLAFTLVKYLTSKKEKVNTKRFFINASLYFVYLFSLIYTDSFEVAGRKLDTAITMLVFPLIFFVFKPFDEKRKEYYSKKFTQYFYFFSVLYAILALINFYLQNAFRFYPDPWLLRNTMEEMSLIGQHPIYASMIISLGILFSFPFFSQGRDQRIKPLVTLLNIPLILVLVLLASKGVIIAIIIAAIAYLFFNIRKRKVKMISIVLIVAGFALSLMYLPSLTHRFKELKEVSSLEIKLDKYNSTSIRKGIYYCSAVKIKENWFFGYGIGDVQPALNDCYETIDDDIFNKFDYNSHNQYLGVLLSTGVFGLFALLLLLISNFHLAITNKDWVFLAVLVLFSVSFLTENLLERQAGVVLFSFLLSFFGQNNVTRKV